MNLDWKKIKEEHYKAGWRKMIRKTFEMPDGKTADYDVYNEGVAVCVLAVTSDQKIVIARQYRPGQEKVLQELPGGASHDGGEALDNIKRELLEETGFSGDFTMIGQSFDDAYSNRVRYHFVCQNAKKVQEQELDETEFIEVELLDLKEFKDLIASGNLTDSETAYRGLEYLKLL